MVLYSQMLHINQTIFNGHLLFLSQLIVDIYFKFSHHIGITIKYVLEILQILHGLNGNIFLHHNFHNSGRCILF